MVKRSSVFDKTVLSIKTFSNIGDWYLQEAIPDLSL
nr:MAG TPA: hypothetical protein [Caudoviricetes sp.]